LILSSQFAELSAIKTNVKTIWDDYFNANHSIFFEWIFYCPNNGMANSTERKRQDEM
jgi:hypothetical protein